MCPPPQVASAEEKPRFLLGAALGRAGREEPLRGLAESPKTATLSPGPDPAPLTKRPGPTQSQLPVTPSCPTVDGHSLHTDHQAKGRHEAVRVRRLEYAADLALGDRRVGDFDLLAVVSVDLGHSVRECVTVEAEH